MRTREVAVTEWEPATEAEAAMRDALRTVRSRAVLPDSRPHRAAPAGFRRRARRSHRDGLGHVEFRRPHPCALLHLDRGDAAVPRRERRLGPQDRLPRARRHLAQPRVVARRQPGPADRGLPAAVVRRAAVPRRRAAARPAIRAAGAPAFDRRPSAATPPPATGGRGPAPTPARPSRWSPTTCSTPSSSTATSRRPRATVPPSGFRSEAGGSSATARRASYAAGRPDAAAATRSAGCGVTKPASSTRP